jgi:hypothetical protein
MPADADRGGDVVHDLQPEHQVALKVSPTGNATDYAGDARRRKSLGRIYPAPTVKPDWGCWRCTSSSSPFSFGRWFLAVPTQSAVLAVGFCLR